MKSDDVFHRILWYSCASMVDADTKRHDEQCHTISHSPASASMSYFGNNNNNNNNNNMPYFFTIALYNITCFLHKGID